MWPLTHACSHTHTHTQIQTTTVAVQCTAELMSTVISDTQCFLLPGFSSVAPDPALLCVCILLCVAPCMCEDRTGRDKGSPVGVFTANITEENSSGRRRGKRPNGWHKATGLHSFAVKNHLRAKRQTRDRDSNNLISRLRKQHPHFLQVLKI